MNELSKVDAAPPATAGGPLCGECSANEQTCAMRAGCCRLCTHTFGADEESRELTCADCDQSFPAPHRGRPPSRCPACRGNSDTAVASPAQDALTRARGFQHPPVKVTRAIQRFEAAQANLLKVVQDYETRLEAAADVDRLRRELAQARARMDGRGMHRNHASPAQLAVLAEARSRNAVPSPCEFCGKMFASRAAAKNHMARFQCPAKNAATGGVT